METRKIISDLNDIMLDLSLDEIKDAKIKLQKLVSKIETTMR